MSEHGSNHQNHGNSTQRNYQADPNRQSNGNMNYDGAILVRSGAQQYVQIPASIASASSMHDNRNWVHQHPHPVSSNLTHLQFSNRTQDRNSPLYPSSQSMVNAPSSHINTSNLANTQHLHRVQNSLSPLYPRPLSTTSISSTPSVIGPIPTRTTSLATSSGHLNTPPHTPFGNQSYQSQYGQQQHPQPPQRYHITQQPVPFQHHNLNTSSSPNFNHQPSHAISQAGNTTRPTASREQNAIVAPSPITVDPSQIYDNSTELQRQHQIMEQTIRYRGAEHTTQRTAEERAAAQAWAERQQKAQSEAAANDEQRTIAEEEDRQDKTAADALQKIAPDIVEALESPQVPPENVEEEEMRAMFKKMREFNAKNPKMLAKLWEEERKTHSQTAKQAAASGPGAQQNTSAAASSPKPISSSRATSARDRSEVGPPAKPSSVPAATGIATQPISSRTTSSTSRLAKEKFTAEVAVRFLATIPQNATSSIDVASMANILANSPSFEGVFQELERRGFMFDRSALDVHLRKAASYLEARLTPIPPGPVESGTVAASRLSQSAGGPQETRKNVEAENQAFPNQTFANQAFAPNSANSAAATTTVNYGSPRPLPNTTMGMTYMHGTGSNPANPRVVAALQPQQNHGQNLSYPRSATDKVWPSSQIQSTGVHSRVEAPKSKGPPHPPANKEEAARKRTFGDLVDLTANDSDDEGPPKKVMHMTNGPVNGVNNQVLPHREQPMLMQPLRHAQAQNASQNAPGNINMHAAPMLGHAPPNGPINPQTIPPQPLKANGRTQEQLQKSRMRGKILVEPLMRDRVMRKSTYDSRTIARDVLVATGRHPSMQGLNWHLGQMQKLLGEHGGNDHEGRGARCDLATIKWDIIDPGPPSQPVAATKSLATSKPEPVRVDEETSGDELQKDTNIHSQHSLAQRRGSPKSRLDLVSGLGSPSTTSQSPKSAPPSSASPNAMSGTPVGYAAFRRFDEQGNPIKKLGRPVGWRKNIHSREAQGLPPKTGSASPLPGRLRQTQSSTAADGRVEPQYQVYKCRWADCKAILHNLDTLKKHIVKIHGRQISASGSGVFGCEWTGCTRRGGKDDAAAGFRDMKAWIEHVENEHLKPIAWELGDGPKGGRLSETSHDSGSYLTDAFGRSVTPVIQSSPSIDGNVPPEQTSLSALPPIKKLGRPLRDSTDENEKDPLLLLKRLEAHKLAVGPVLDRTGCVLVNEERRHTFLEDEDFEDEVEGSDFGDVEDE